MANKPIKFKVLSELLTRRNWHNPTLIIYASLAIFIFSFLLYYQSISFKLVWDDHAVISYNSNLRSWSSAFSTFYKCPKKEYFKYDPSSMTTQNYRPLRTILHRAVYNIYGVNPKPYHLLNVLCHALVVLLLFHVLRLVVRHDSAALLGALIFSCHPILTETVCWAKSLEDLMATAFLLSSLLFLFKRNENRTKTIKVLDLFIAAGFYFLALISKLSVIFLPVFLGLLFLSRVLRQRDGMIKSFFQFAKNRWAMICVAIIAIEAAIAVLMRHIVLGHTAQGAFFTGDRWTTLLSMPRVLLRYLRLEILPIGLLADYQAYPQVKSLLDPEAWFCAIALLALLAAGSCFLSRRRLLGGWIWFWTALLPFINIIPMVQLGAERFLYIATIGLCWLFAESCSRVKNFARIWLVTIPIMIAFIFLTWNRAKIWSGELELWKETSMQAPNNERALHNLCKAYLADRKPKEALPYSRRLIEKNPSNRNLVMHGLILCLSGHENEGIEILHKEQAHIVLNIAGAEFARQRKKALARKCFELAIKIKPDDPRYQINLKTLNEN